jgi:hypothetical protein
MSSVAASRPAGGAAGSALREVGIALIFVAVALLLRSLGLVYSVMNYDESMYILMGAEFAKGHLPFTTLCDLKPFGLFAVFAAFTSLPFDGVVTSRIAAAVTVGLTGYALSGIAGLLFKDETRVIGVSAGLGYVTFSLADGGLAAQGEIFHNACAVLGLLIALRSLRRPGPPRILPFAAAGLVLGVGLQIKQSVLFDMLAFLAGYLILTMPRPSALVTHVRASLPALAALGVASVVPTLAVIILYVAAGQWDAWVAANITAHQVFYGLERPFELEPALRAAVEQAPLWLGALCGVLLSPRLARDAPELRACAFLAAWVAAIVVCQLFLRIASDHYFLQFLPPLGLLTGFALGRGLLAHVGGWRVAGGLLALLVGLCVFGIAYSPIVNSVYVLRDRLVGGQAWAGDTPRQIAADLRPALLPNDSIYVVGFQPLVYYLTQARIPTRFAFTGLPNRGDYPGRDGCPWVPQDVEMQRILDQQPKFIVIEQGIFFHELLPEPKSILTDRLAAAYKLRATYEPHRAHHLYPFQRFVMNGGAAAQVYELVQQEAPPAPVAPTPEAASG